MHKRFFKPFVGAKYRQGINGKRILVIGSSFYCDHNGINKPKCPYFSECTNPMLKDSSKFDKICPIYSNTNQYLSNEPSNALSENYRVYQNFAKFMEQFIDDKSDVWEYLAFTDYVQFFSPTIITYSEYLSLRDFDAFCETLSELQPDVVVTWGNLIAKAVREQNEFVMDSEDLSKTEYYVCHLKMPNVNHVITLVSSYHPSSYKWYTDFGKLSNYFSSVIKKH